MSTEVDVSAAIKGLLTLMGGEWYSTEVGSLGSWEDGKFKPRPGGTRTTSGYPDLAAEMPWPVHYRLTVEAKGSSTKIRENQWKYALIAMRNGSPHLIARSAEAVYTGLWFFGLLSKPLLERPPFRDWEDYWPENAFYLPRARSVFWKQMWPLPLYELPPAWLLDDLPKRMKRPPYPDPVGRPEDSDVYVTWSGGKIR